MARSVWKGPFVELSPAEEGRGCAGCERRAPIKTWSRRFHILPQFVGLYRQRL
jgi:small subunit ribosomal protein S19